MTTLIYPEDLENNIQDNPFIIFNAKEYYYVKKSDNYGDYRKNATKNSLGAVALYLPPINESFNTTWGDIKSVSTLFGTMGKDFVKGVANMVGNSGDTIEATQQIHSGTAIGKDTIPLFQDITNRSFTFSFTFTPKSKKESASISKIINFFRYQALPDFQPNSNSLTVKIPSMFSIVVKNMGEGETYKFKDTFKFQDCSLTSVNVNYGEGQYMHMMVDKTPQTITMSLTFKELFKPYKSDFEEWK